MLSTPCKNHMGEMGVENKNVHIRTMLALLNQQRKTERVTFIVTNKITRKT